MLHVGPTKTRSPFLRLNRKDLRHRGTRISASKTITTMHLRRRKIRQSARGREKHQTRVVIARQPQKFQSKAKRKRKSHNLILLCGEAIRVASLDTLKMRNTTSTAIYATLCWLKWRPSNKSGWLLVDVLIHWLYPVKMSYLHLVTIALASLESSLMSFNSHLNLFWSKSWPKI